MNNYIIASILVGICICIVLGFSLKSKKKTLPSRPSINIDFDSAKEKEDKNRYFS